MPGILHVSRRLTDVSLLFPTGAPPMGKDFFIERPTPYLSDQFASLSKANLIVPRDASPNGDDDLPQEVNLLWDPDISFTVGVYSLSNPDKWITFRNADQSLNPERTRALVLKMAMKVRMEYLRINQRLRQTSLMTTNRTLLTAEQWDNNNSSSSKPLTLIQQYADQIRDNNDGRPPNRAMCAIQVLRAISKSEEFKEAGIKYNVVTDQMDVDADPNGAIALVERTAGLKRNSLRIYDATYNAGSIASPSYKKFIGSDFVMAYVEPLGLDAYSATVGWRWNEVPDEESIVEVPQLLRGAFPGTELRIISAHEPQIIKPELAVVIKNCVNTSDPGYGGKLD